MRIETPDKVSNAEVQIINTIGEIVGKYKSFNNEGIIDIQVKKSNLINGFYHVKYLIGTATGSIKMVIQR